MAEDIVKELDTKVKEIKRQYGAVATVALAAFDGLAKLLCLKQFLILLAKNPALLSQFTSFLNGLLSTATATLTAVQLLVNQLNLLNQLTSSAISLYRGAASKVTGGNFGGQYPFKEFADCPPVQFVVKTIKKLIPKPSMPSALSNNKYVKGYNSYKNKIKRLEFEIRRRVKQVEKLTALIDLLKIQIEFLQFLVTTTIKYTDDLVKEASSKL